MALIPHMRQPARVEMLRTWLQAAGLAEESQPQDHEHAWEALRSVVRAGR